MGENRSTYANLWRLTEREAEVLELLAEGLTNDEIARHLGIDERTARTHVRGVFGKLDVTNRTQAAVCVWRKRLERLKAENARLRVQAVYPDIDVLAQMMSQACEDVLREAGLGELGVTVNVTMEW